MLRTQAYKWAEIHVAVNGIEKGEDVQVRIHHHHHRQAVSPVEVTHLHPFVKKQKNRPKVK